MPYRTFLFLSLTGLIFTGAALADETKKEVHNQADLPRATYPVTGSVSTLLQSDDSVFGSAVSKAAADLNALFSDYDIKDNATLISVLTAKLSLQELNGDAVGGLQTISKIRELQSKPDLKLTELIISGSTLSADGKRKLVDEKRSLQLIKQKATATATSQNMSLLSAMGIASPAAVLVLAASLLLGACAATDNGKKDDPVFFGGASGANGAGGATSGMSFSW